MIRPGHDDPHVETVIEDHRAYQIVEKFRHYASEPGFSLLYSRAWNVEISCVIDTSTGRPLILPFIARYLIVPTTPSLRRSTASPKTESPAMGDRRSASFARKRTMRAPSRITLTEAWAAWEADPCDGSIRNRSGGRYEPSAVRSYSNVDAPSLSRRPGSGEALRSASSTWKQSSMECLPPGPIRRLSATR
jgi:hypothetical protein